MLSENRGYAWDMEQVTIPKFRPRLAAANPDPDIVASHDAMQLSDCESAAKIGKGFSIVHNP